MAIVGHRQQSLVRATLAVIDRAFMPERHDRQQSPPSAAGSAALVFPAKIRL
jgi:hypothetical protein